MSLNSTFINGQNIVNFSGSPTVGCAPLNVQFTNSSSQTGDLSYLWDFGNGATSTAKNPQTTYLTAGEFTVKLTIIDEIGSNSTTKEAYIKVGEKPTAYFTYEGPTEDCVPFSTSFKNESSDSSESDLIYTWSFGDGEGSVEENPEHTYYTAGVYNVTLVAKNSYCQDSYTLNRTIEAVKPQAVFGVNNNESCSGQLNAIFTNLSNARESFSSQWNFGDGSISQEKDPTHLYTQPGEYSVQLKVTDDLGCTDSVQHKNLIQITEIQSDFEVSTTKGCINEKIKFTNLSKNASNYLWHFDDGTSSTQANPEKTYTKPGNYKVKLAAKNGSCTAEKIIQINIEEAVAEFDLSNNYICQLPTSITYVNQSESAVNYDWRFGNGQVSNEKSPTILYDETTKLNNYQAVFSDTLIVTSANGCKSIYVKKNSVKIHLPNVQMSPGKGGNATSLNGCIPMNLSFQDKTIYNSDVDKIASYQWRINGEDLRTGKSTNYSVTKAQRAPVELTVTTEKGCVSQAVEYINAGDKYEVDFERTSNYENCANKLISFKINAPNRKNITNEIWDFGDDSEPGFPIPAHHYEKTGVMDVSLTIFNYGCASKLTRKNYVKILGPHATFEKKRDCQDPFKVQFESDIQDATEYSWDFGDGSPNVHNVKNPIHIYSQTGNYTVRLTALNSATGCDYTSIKDVYIRNLVSDFEISSEAPCLNNTLTLDGNSSQDISPFSYKGSTVEYLWIFEEENVTIGSLKPLQHKFTHKGVNHVSLVVKDANGCTDTLTREILIHQPEPNFIANHEVGCMPITFSFTDQTISRSPIETYEWNFGDGSSDNNQNPTHEYSSFGQYNVSLKVTDQLGCSNTLTKKEMIKAVELKATFEADKHQLCTDDSAIFSATTKNEIVDYYWTFSNGVTSTLSNPKVKFSTPGYHSVSLNIKDIYGCEASATMSSYIDVQEPPKTEFSSDITTANCYPFIVQFKNQTETDYPGSWQWSFGESRNHSKLKDPFFIYNRPGNHDVTLISKTTYGCADTLVKKAYIRIDGPYAEFQLPDSVCLNDEVQFKAINLEKVYDLRWDFGDGYGEPNNNQTHSYSTAGNKNPVLFLRTDAENSCNVALVDTLHVLDLKAIIGFQDDISDYCVPAEVQFKNNSKNSTSWLWQLDNQVTSTDKEPLWHYEKDGEYPITLTAKHDGLGCVHTTTFSSLNIHPLPNVNINNDTVICLNSSATLWATGGVDYQWWPTEDLEHPNANSTLAKPRNNEWFQVSVTDKNGCINYGATNVYVQQKPFVHIPDTTLIVGEKIKINIENPAISAYSWSPSSQLSCNDCPSPTIHALESTLYQVMVTDTSQCFTLSYPFQLDVRKVYSVDLPDAFTPNGDGVNDIVYVKGWGIEELITFKVYNRSGRMIFESNNIEKGWDGTFNGIQQPIETYTYLVQVKTYDKKILSKTGAIKLLR